MRRFHEKGKIIKIQRSCSLVKKGIQLLFDFVLFDYIRSGLLYVILIFVQSGDIDGIITCKASITVAEVITAEYLAQ